MSMTSNADLDLEITHQARQEAIGKYRAFIDDVYQDIANTNERLNLSGTVFSGLEPFRHLSEPPITSTITENEASTSTLLDSPDDSSLVVEHTNYFQLLQTCGNTQLNKLMLVFATLTDELETLTRGASAFINPIVLYREDLVAVPAVSSSKQDEGALSSSEESWDEDDEYTATATILPVLFDLVLYLRRCYEVATSLLLQKHSMLAYATVRRTDQDFQSSLREVLPDLNPAIRFDVAWTALANLCLALINLDQVFAAQANTLRRDIFNYRRSLEAVSKSLTSFDLQAKEAEIQTLLTVLEEVQKELFDGRIAGRAPTEANQSGGHEIDYLFFRGLVVSVLNTNVSEGGAMARNTALNENIAAFIRSTSAEVEASTAAAAAASTPSSSSTSTASAASTANFIVDAGHRLLSTSALYALYVHLFWAAADRRLAKTALTDVQRKCALSYVPLRGNVSLAPDQLLVACLPKGLVEKKVLDGFAASREALLKVGALEAAVRGASGTLTQWLATMEQSLNAGFNATSADKRQETEELTHLVFSHVNQLKEGVEAVRVLSSALHSTIAAHTTANRPLSRTDTVALCRAVILLKGVQRFLGSHHQHRKTLLEAVGHYQKYSAIALLQILTRAKGRILAAVSSSANSYSEQKLDLLSAVILAANCLNGPVLTTKRHCLASLALAYVTPYSTVFTAEDAAKTALLLRRLATFMGVFGQLRRLLDCRFLYFNRALVQEYFRHFYEASSAVSSDGSAGSLSTSTGSSSLTNTSELQYFFAALDDALPLLSATKGNGISKAQSTKLIAAFTEDVARRFRETVLSPLCKDFEDELRYRTHAGLALAENSGSPFAASGKRRKMKDFAALLSAEPLKLAGGRRLLWIRRAVEQHLTALAYNMTAIALHDWKTYESMLGWARAKYGLTATASLQLPTQTLEQGLDVLEITRNLPVFVAAYAYNLHNQFFVERSSTNKHLNVLTIRHVANSVQTHGFGVINSTVNAAYQFLKRKFQTLSAFLYEEHIKSRLIKDIRQFREMVVRQGEQTSSSSFSAASVSSSAANPLVKFPYERAEKFVKGIRKLGVSATGDGQSTYLDRFRQLLTQIGNVLGFVRMLRSGALHCTSEIANFVPDLEDLGTFTFEELLREETVGEEGGGGGESTAAHFNSATLDAAANFDAALATVATNFSEATDYFRLLVEVFAPTLRDSKNAHLRNFFVILPATTYNYVQHSIAGKERLARTAKKKLHQQQQEDHQGSTSANSSSSSGATFTDDGFAMGVVYVLKLLDQLADFDSLQWFSSVEEHLRATIRRSTEQNGSQAAGKSKDSGGSSHSSAGGVVDEKLLQTTSLTIRRLEVLQREYQLLKYSMSSCRILFKSAD